MNNKEYNGEKNLPCFSIFYVNILELIGKGLFRIKKKINKF
jgi:hypothetical protein